MQNAQRYIDQRIEHMEANTKVKTEQVKHIILYI